MNDGVALVNGGAALVAAAAAAAAICRSTAELAESRDAVIRTIIRKPSAAGRNYDAKLVARLVSFMNVRNAAIILL